MNASIRTHLHHGKPRHIAVHPTLPLLAVIMKHEPQVLIYNHECMCVEHRIDMNVREGDNCLKHGEIRALEWFDKDCIHAFRSEALHRMDFDAAVAARKASRKPMYANQSHVDYVVVTFDKVLLMLPVNQFDARRQVMAATRDEIFGCHSAATKDDEFIRCSAMFYTLPFIAAGSSAGKISFWGYRSESFHAQVTVKGTPTAMRIWQQTANDVLEGNGYIVMGLQNGMILQYRFATNPAVGLPRLQDAPLLQTKAFSDGPCLSLEITQRPQKPDKYVVHVVSQGAVHAYTLLPPSSSQQLGVKISKRHVLGQARVVYDADADPHFKRGVTYLVPNEYNKVYAVGPDGSMAEFANLKKGKQGDDVHIYSVAGMAGGQRHGGLWIASNQGLAHCTLPDDASAVQDTHLTAYKSSSKKVYATHGQNTLTVFHGAERGQAQVVCQKQMAAKRLFGGKWLGVVGGTYNTVQFYEWSTLDPVATDVKTNIPAPDELVWAEVTGLCAVVYPHAVYVLAASDHMLRHYCRIGVRGVTACLWACRGTVLFVHNGDGIVALFPYNGGHDRERVASVRVGEHYAALLTLEEGGASEPSLAAAPAHVCPQHCTLDSFTAGGGLRVTAADGSKHTIPLPPAVQWMALAQMGEREAAMQWADAGAVNPAVVTAFFDRRAGADDAAA